MLAPRIMIGLVLLFAPATLAVAVGDTAPSLPFDRTWNSRNAPVSLQELRGKTVFVEVFATWSRQSIDSVPHLAEMQRKFTPRGLEVLMVSDESESQISAWIKRHNVKVPVAQSQGSRIAQLFGARGYPSAYLIDPQGAVAWQGDPMRADDALVERILAQPVTTAAVSSPPAAIGDWWVWVLVLLAAAFAAAVGWFWWRTRDRIPAHLKPPGAGYVPLPGSRSGPQAVVLPPVAPTQGAYLANTPGEPPPPFDGQPFHGPHSTAHPYGGSTRVIAGPAPQPQSAVQAQARPDDAMRDSYPLGGLRPPTSPTEGLHRPGTVISPMPKPEPDLRLHIGGGGRRNKDILAAPFQVAHRGGVDDERRSLNTTFARGAGQHMIGQPPQPKEASPKDASLQKTPPPGPGLREPDAGDAKASDRPREPRPKSDGGTTDDWPLVT